jgi:hypothetical protein
MREVLQRDDGAHEPRKQGELFILKKGNRHQAVCTLWSHPLGWELRLNAAREMIRTQVCQTQNEVLDTSDAWKAAMRERGWR